MAEMTLGRTDSDPPISVWSCLEQGCEWEGTSPGEYQDHMLSIHWYLLGDLPAS